MIKVFFAIFFPMLSIAQITIEVVPVWNTTKLEKRKSYGIEASDSIKVTAFSVYLGKFNGNTSPENYHLVDAFNAASLTFTIPALTNDTLAFVIGVDSVLCTSGVLEGDLDPAKGMYWAWNTGYIHAKLQGTSNKSPDAHKEFEFHIGGYLSPFAPLQKVVIPINQGSKKIVLYMDAYKWFYGTYPVDLSKTYHVVDPGREAKQISENYKNMFRLKG